MKIQLVKGDITRVEADVIVNAANSRLAGGGGVDGAIHRAGGPGIMKECDKIRKDQGGCPTGEAVITTAGNLSARYVIHAVGPVWRDGKAGEAQHLHDAYWNSMRLAEEYHARSVAFPGISTGIYGYPLAEAADIALQTILEYEGDETGIEDVIFVCFDQESYEVYQKKLRALGRG